MTLMLIKPDAHERELEAELIESIKDEVGSIIAKQTYCNVRDKWERHYAEHAQKDFYPNLMNQMCRGKVTALVVRGNIKKGREHTMTLRTDYAVDKTNNTVHASDSEPAFWRELKIWFDGEKYDHIKSQIASDSC